MQGIKGGRTQSFYGGRTQGIDGDRQRSPFTHAITATAADDPDEGGLLEQAAVKLAGQRQGPPLIIT